MNITAIMGAAIIRSGKKGRLIEVCSVFVFGNSFQPCVLMYEELQRQWVVVIWVSRRGLLGASSLILSPVSALCSPSYLFKSHPTACFFFLMMIWPTNNKMPDRCLFKMKYQKRSSGSGKTCMQFLLLSAALKLIQDRLRSLTSKTTALTTPWPEPLSKSQLYSSHPTGWLRQKDSTVVAPAFSYLWEKSSSCFLGCFTHSSPFLHNVGP